jgi:hypothetical protein
MAKITRFLAQSTLLMSLQCARVEGLLIRGATAESRLVHCTNYGLRRGCDDHRGEFHQLFEQSLDRVHRHEQPSFDIRQFEESILFVESDSRSILRVHDDACGSDFPAVLKNPVERVHEECLAASLPSEGRTYRQTSDKSCRHHRIFRQLSGHLQRQLL